MDLKSKKHPNITRSSQQKSYKYVFMRIFSIFFVVSAICYPLILPFDKRIILIMVFVWGMRAFIIEGAFEKLLYVFIACFFVLVFYMKEEFLAYLYPVFISVGFFVIFANSLKNEAIITKLARISREKRHKGILDSKAIAYTRLLTKIWCVFFLLNATLAFILALLENKFFWSAYCGVVFYVLFGMLFGLEFLYRYFVLKVR